MELITSTNVVRNLCKKMALHLLTLLSAEPEIQYVTLRNTNFIVQKHPAILAHEIMPVEAFITRVKTTQKTEDEEYVDAVTPSALALPGLVDLGMDKNNSASANQPATPTDPPLPDILPASSGQGLEINA
ncbi:hypothetical protein CQW23_07825 [Capsicum baccatum]|uniref:Uncharacterized protein n=1 Tax=Capsicum baccatum TaxID=33114 RepID=A0A2G2X7A6_CAPBA|nr:hypothetical protein CQW23_07825 [Capsicum baccatum]